MTGKKTGKRKSCENSSAEHSTFRQSIIALNPPSIYFDKPKVDPYRKQTGEQTGHLCPVCDNYGPYN
jgi:hypothetical protein